LGVAGSQLALRLAIYTTTPSTPSSMAALP